MAELKRCCPDMPLHKDCSQWIRDESGNYICPECGHAWDPKMIEENTSVRADKLRTDYVKVKEGETVMGILDDVRIYSRALPHWQIWILWQWGRFVYWCKN